MFSVVDRAVPSSKSLGLDPEFVVIGPDPPFTRPSEIRSTSVRSALQLVEKSVDEDHLVVNRLAELMRVD